MKKVNNKKGFTIVELVIVIAVIAILAAVLIPTFSGVVEKANKTAALEKAKNALTAVLTENNGSIGDAHFAVVDGDKTYWFAYADGSVKEEDPYDVKTVTDDSTVYISDKDVVLDDTKSVITKWKDKADLAYANAPAYVKAVFEESAITEFVAGTTATASASAVPAKVKIATSVSGAASANVSCNLYCVADIASGVVAIVLPKA